MRGREKTAEAETSDGNLLDSGKREIERLSSIRAYGKVLSVKTGCTAKSVIFPWQCCWLPIFREAGLVER